MNSTSIAPYGPASSRSAPGQHASAWTALAAAAASCHPHAPWKRLRMLLRSWFWRQETEAWLSFLQRGEYLPCLIRQRARLIEKLHRPYLRRDLGVRERLQCLIEHYLLVQRVFSLSDLRRLHFVGGHCLAACADRTGAQHELRLSAAERCEGEGEMRLGWYRHDAPEALAQLSFSLMLGDDGPLIYVGGLQGMRGGDARERVRQATRDCDGLQPRMAVALGLMAFGEALGVSAIHAVADGCHVSRSLLPGRRLRASHDRFWTRLGAVRNAAGDHVWSAARPPRAPEHVQSSRCAARRRRQLRVAQLTQAIGASLQLLLRQGPHGRLCQAGPARRAGSWA
ncbi:MAG: DUF535 family protein [Pseudomonadota bacterium]|nr:DUF535 family protein [Pseudomonadota bacterium]